MRVLAVRLVSQAGRSRIVRGFALRQAATRLWGNASVRSTLFDILELPNEYLLVGRGSGHGAGLCQQGALARARRGAGWREILAFYYRGATIGSLAMEGTR